MQKLTIANIIEEGRFGGPQNRMFIVANSLKFDSHIETVLIFPKLDSQIFIEKCTKNNIQYKTISLSRLTKQKSKLLKYIFSTPLEIFTLTRFLKTNNIDIVHVSGGVWQLKGAISGRLAQKKVLWHLNDTSMPFLIRRVFSWLSFLADGYIYSSKRTKIYYQKLVNSGKPEFVIPAPVDTEKFSPEAVCSRSWREEMGLQGKIIIGMVANINPTKGIEILIETANMVTRSRDNVVFAVAGPVYSSQQNYYFKLEKLIRDYALIDFRFLGPMDDTRIFLKEIDIYACCSWNESSPLSVWEAMSMMKPIVSTDVGDVGFHLEHETTGILVETGSVDQFETAILSLIDNPQTRADMGAAARQRAIEALDIGICKQKHKNAYSDISRR